MARSIEPRHAGPVMADPPIPYGPLPAVYTFPDIKPVAVLDSNVIMEAVSYHDLERVRDDKEKFQFRKKRMRDTLILCEYLHRHKLATFGMRDEPILKLLELVPAEQATALTEYIKTAIDFLVEDIFRDTNFGCFDDDIPEPRANAADAFLVDAAKHYGVPIITNEGLRPDGTWNPKKEIPKFAAAAGVRVQTPAEFWAGKIDPRAACSRIERSVQLRRVAFAKRQEDPQLAELNCNRLWRVINFVLNENAELLTEPSSTEDIIPATLKR